MALQAAEVARTAVAAATHRLDSAARTAPAWWPAERHGDPMHAPSELAADEVERMHGALWEISVQQRVVFGASDAWRDSVAQVRSSPFCLHPALPAAEVSYRQCCTCVVRRGGGTPCRCCSRRCRGPWLRGGKAL